MAAPGEKRLTISEVSELTGISLHVLRSWEKRIGKLRPKRTRAGRRAYTSEDVELIRAVKYLIKHKGMTLAGANRTISQEGHKGALPKSPESALSVIKKIQGEVRGMIEEIKRLKLRD